ncbi:MAG: hypothetical protein Q9181_007357 [Wetmoreana brouardii]
MPRGRPRKYTGPEEVNTARRTRRQTQHPGRSSQQSGHHLSIQIDKRPQIPGQIVWEATIGPPQTTALSPLPPEPLLEDLLASTDLNAAIDGDEVSDEEGDPVSQATGEDAATVPIPHARVWSLTPSLSPSPPLPPAAPVAIRDDPAPSRSHLNALPRPMRQRSPTALVLTAHQDQAPADIITDEAGSGSLTAESSIETSLPAAAVAHFLATQYQSLDPAQTLLSFAQSVPNVPADLLQRLERHYEVSEPLHGDDVLSPSAGLEHIQSHYGADQQLPDVISQPSIEAPSVQYTGDELQYLFTGHTCDADRPFRPKIDPVVGSLKDYVVTTEFDIDSLILSTSHLGVFRQGILWYPAQMPTGAITTSMHMKTRPVQYTDNHGHLHRRRVPMHHIPNYCFARLPGADGITVHWFFPRLYEPSEVTVAEKGGQRLSDHHFARWTDRILLPSLTECLPPGRLQHLPSSFRHAKANARAYHAETHTSTTNAGSRHQNLQYEIPAEYLSAVQDAVTRRVQQPGNQIFGDAFLVVIGKGLKLQPWKTSRLSSTVEYFSDWLTRHFDPQHFSEDTTHVDLGKETLSSSPSTFLWREEFLRLFALCLSACAEDRSVAKPTFYPWGFLRGVGDTTLEPNLDSALRGHGVSYVQHYGSFKEIFAAGNTYVFSNPHLSNLTVSPEVLATLQHVGGAISVRPEVLARSYIHCKLRSHHGLMGSAAKTYGNRWETRMTLRLLRQVHQCARHLPPPSPFQARASCAWVAHPTSALVDWQRFHLNKFCFAFETIYARCRERPYIAWEHTQLMVLMLKCVSCFQGRLVPGSYPQLWQDWYQPAASRGRRPVMTNSRPHHGLAIGANMLEDGYGWLADKIDWANLVLRPEVSGQFRVQHLSILSTFRTHYRRLRNHMDDYVLIASLVSPFHQWKDSPVHVAYLLRLLRAVCLRAFHRDVFQILRPHAHAEQWPDIEQGRLSLSADVLDRVIDHARARNRVMASSHQKIRSFHVLFQWLWGEDDGFQRGPWQHLPYRMLFAFCKQLLTDIVGPDHFRVWRRALSRHVRINFWLLPYPGNNLLASYDRLSDGRVEFRWWSNYNHKLAQHLGDNGSQIIRCRHWHSWPPGRWSVTPEKDTMRGLPRPDIQMAFLRAEQVIAQLQALSVDEHEANSDDDDEDGLDAEGIRDVLGFRRGLATPDPASSSDASDPNASDTDSTELSEYEDRRRIRAGEKEHQRVRQRLGIIRQSLRLEKQTFQKSITRFMRQVPEDHHPGRSNDVEEIMHRYDIRLAHVASEEARHSRTITGLSRRRLFSLQQARHRRQERHEVALQAKLEAQRRQREIVRQEQQAERRRQARMEEARVRHEQQWLISARRQRQGQQRRILAPLDTRGYIMNS